MKNKRGETSWYVIAAGLVVMVLVFMSFALWEVITGPGNKLVGDKDNVGLIILECEAACLSNSKIDYCERERMVYSEDESLAGKRNCNYLQSNLDDLNCGIKC